jgi:predicted dehydrogenase
VIRLGLVGVGRWGRRYIETIGRRTDCRVVAIARRSRDEIDLPLPGVRRRQTWNDLVQDVTRGELDGVIVATEPRNQAEIAAACVAGGAPALLEKPLGLKAEEAEAVLRSARARGSNPPLMVDFIHLWAPAYRELKARVASDSKDAISHIESRGENRGPFRGWSAVHDYGAHDVAMCLDLLGRHAAFRIDDTRWKKRVPGTGAGLLETDLALDGVAVSMRVGNEAEAKARRFTVTMRSGRTLVYDDLQPVERKLTDGGEPVEIDSVSPLDLVLTHFCGQIESWRRRELSTDAALEWLELSAAVSRILDAIIQS